MSSRNFMDDQSVGSDDTPATSNVGFDHSRTFDVPLDDDALAPYERQQQLPADESNQPDAEDTSSQPRYEEIDDTALSSDFHARRDIYNRDPNEDDDDLELQESFAVGDLSSGSLIRYTEPVELSLSAIPELDLEQALAVPANDEPEEIGDASHPDTMAPEPVVEFGGVGVILPK